MHQASPFNELVTSASVVTVGSSSCDQLKYISTRVCSGRQFDRRITQRRASLIVARISRFPAPGSAQTRPRFGRPRKNSLGFFEFIQRNQ
jgi:hypothetical protein